MSRPALTSIQVIGIPASLSPLFNRHLVLSMALTSIPGRSINVKRSLGRLFSNFKVVYLAHTRCLLYPFFDTTSRTNLPGLCLLYHVHLWCISLYLRPLYSLIYLPPWLPISCNSLQISFFSWPSHCDACFLLLLDLIKLNYIFIILVLLSICFLVSVLWFFRSTVAI